MSENINNYSVYVHINRINGKKYVGITSKARPSSRWGKDGRLYKLNEHFFAAIQKYGWNNFEHIILYSGLTKEEASLKEIELIKEYKSYDPSFGYNQSLGGDGFLFKHSPASKEKISKSISGERNPNWQGKSNTPEQMKKLLNANIGSHHTDEHKAKIANSLRGRKHHSDQRKLEMSEKYSIPVKRSDGIVYPSFSKAAIENGVTQPAISNSMRRGTRCAGYYWSYA